MTYAVLDVETTGLDPDSDNIIEIGIILLDEALEQEGTFHRLIQPRRAVSAQHIHHISDAMLAQAPSFSEIDQEIISILDGRIVVAHNAMFDLRFINAEFSRTASPAFIHRKHAVCTMDQSQIYCPPGSHSLVGLATRLGIEVPVAHRALADALTCSYLFKHYFCQEQQGHRYTSRACNRQGETVLPCEWERATPWVARSQSNLI
ncbi:3'-5' exonuclease [Arcanobacterium phocae]|uniref:DNA polymerase-3 subunit epsilon n=1 Tax=Arcanobacterium phocae TaxID=131112 RepID=A0A1H2LKH0_9ACTO|nr:3'-5' exonuclease [Arcanobacterium phocae]SDU81352.1 DNA polymerase-3 subunit epsilon [Arcanobacterium phocae]